MTNDASTENSGMMQGCRRCGTCCTKGGPAFHNDDKHLIEKGAILSKYLYTIRKGEPVHDNVRDRRHPLPSEIIKIKSREGSATCIFFNAQENRCGIYGSRPVECRVLECWNTSPLEAIYDRHRLTRHDLLKDMEGVWDLVCDHEERCGIGELRSRLDQYAGGDTTVAAERILEMVSYDQNLRLLVTEKMGLPSDMTDFLFGRSLVKIIDLFGIRLEQKGEKLVLKMPLTKGFEI